MLVTVDIPDELVKILELDIERDKQRIKDEPLVDLAVDYSALERCTVENEVLTAVRSFCAALLRPSDDEEPLL